MKILYRAGGDWLADTWTLHGHYQVIYYKKQKQLYVNRDENGLWITQNAQSERHKEAIEKELQKIFLTIFKAREVFDSSTQPRPKTKIT